MKKIISMLIMIALTFSPILLAASAAKPLDQIVAIVNDDIITNSELNDAFGVMRMQAMQENASIPSPREFKKQVLNQLIEKKLQLQVAKQSGITVTDQDLDKAIANVASQNHLSVETLYEKLAESGMPKKLYRNEIRDQMTMHKLQQMEVVSRVRVSQQEIKSYMNSKLWNNNVDKSYRLQDILIPLPDAPSSQTVANAKKLATTIFAQLQNGKEINEVKQSSPKGSVQTGDLGFRKLAEIPSAFAGFIANMRVNDVAGPIQTSNGFHIIRLADLRNLGSQQASISKKQVEELLLQRKFDTAIRNWVSKLRSQAYIVMTQTS